MSNELEEAKRKLLDKLGSNYGVYIQLLGKWFRGMISKEEFDKNAKHIIKRNFVLEHNKFWLAFFHHCANNTSNNALGNSHSFQANHQVCGDSKYSNTPPSNGHSSNYIDGKARNHLSPDEAVRVKCLPNKVITHMKIYVIAWEMGLDSVNDQVSVYLNLALQHFLKNIITELICAKTAYRLRENRFKYAIGVKPMNPYLNNSLRIYTSNLEYDPYQIESNKMNSSLLDTCIYNDTLFPARLYESQALYEYACSTASVSGCSQMRRGAKRLKLSEIFLNHTNDYDTAKNEFNSDSLNFEHDEQDDQVPNQEDIDCGERRDCRRVSERRLTLHHLLNALLTNRTIIPSKTLYSINLERIYTKLSC